jgi:PAS domain S-box-containing protein
MAKSGVKLGGLPNHFLSLEKMAESEQRFRQLVECLPEAIIVHTEGKIVFVNPFALRLLAAEGPEQLLGHDISDFIKPECLPTIRKRATECYLTGMASSPTEAVLIACDGSSVDIEAVAIPTTWNGAPAIEAVLRDNRTRKRAEEAAQTWQQRLELAQKAGLCIGLWDWDVVANTVIWSDETYRQFGYTRDTFSGRVEDAASRIHAKDQKRVNSAIRKVLAGEAKEYSAQYRVVHPDGTTKWIDARGVVVVEGSTHMIGIGVDITDLKNTAQCLEDSEEKYRNLYENTTYGIFLAKPDGTLLDVNPALVAMLGYGSREELLTHNLERDIYETSSERASIIANASPDHRVDGVQASWRHKDGKLFPVRMSGAAVRGKDGGISHYEVIVEDITERHNLEAQFRQSQKMEAVGQLAGGISHDFNNLLGVILGNADLLREKNQSGAQLHNVDAITVAGKSAAQLIRQLLAFSRKQVLYPTLMDVNTIVRETGKMLNRLISEDVRITTELEPELGSIRADRGQVEQILMNLATNARDAMPGGGTLSIRTENAELGEDDVARYPYVKPGQYVRLSVSDTGMGMSEEVRSHIFEPFFTTKQKGRGTGLGLATVYGIVKQSGGYIWTSSSLGAGASFNIYLPRVEEKAPPLIAGVQVRNEYPRGTETIFVLEDEESLRQVTCEFLTASGYNILQAGCSDVAIALASQYEGKIPLIVTDVILPDVSGPSAVSKLQVLHPEMRALYVSGYAEAPVAQRLIAEGAILLQKPLSRIDLLRKVDEMLHSGSARV